MITSLNSDTLVEIFCRTNCPSSLREVCKTFHEIFFPAFFKACQSSSLLQERVDRITRNLPENTSAQEKVKALYRSLVIDSYNTEWWSIPVSQETSLEDLYNIIEQCTLMRGVREIRKDLGIDQMLSVEQFNQLESRIEDRVLQTVARSCSIGNDASPQVTRKRMNEQATQLAAIKKIGLTSNWFKQNIGLGLPRLPKEISLLTQLEWLNISDSGLSSLPFRISQLISLKTLNSEWNCLTSLIHEIRQLTQLETLYLDFNHLTQFPQEICHLRNLKILEIGLNKLSQLPPEMGLLIHLEELHVHNNQLTSVPFEQLTSLIFLNLSDCTRLREASEKRWTNKKISQLSHLKELTVRIPHDKSVWHIEERIKAQEDLAKARELHNQLTHLPPGIGLLTRLQTLWLDRNQLSTLPDEMRLLTNLKELHLSFNPLKNYLGRISELTQLERLMLDQEQLTYLSESESS